MKGETIEEIKDPKEKKMVVNTKSVLISRMIKEDKETQYKTAIIRFFDVNNPHLQNIFPKKTITFTNTEKVRIMGLNMSFYLEGSDLVINDLEELQIYHEKSKIFLKGKQSYIERRDSE